MINAAIQKPFFLHQLNLDGYAAFRLFYALASHFLN